MGGGLTVWFDRSGSDDKTFGVNYPLVGNLHESWQRAAEDIDKDSGTVKYSSDLTSFDMEIIGPHETDRYRISTVNNQGIIARIGRIKGNEMIYELQVPLKKTADHPKAIDPKNEFFGLGFETGPLNIHSNKPGADQSGFSSEGGMGRGHHGGSSGGWRSHHDGSQRPEHPPDPIKLWWKVKL